MGIEIVLVLRFGPERGRYLLIGVVWVPILLLTVVKKHPAFNKLVQAVGGMDSWPVGQLAVFFGGLVICRCYRVRGMLAHRCGHLPKKESCKCIKSLSLHINRNGRDGK